MEDLRWPDKTQFLAGLLGGASSRVPAGGSPGDLNTQGLNWTVSTSRFETAAAAQAILKAAQAGHAEAQNQPAALSARGAGSREY